MNVLVHPFICVGKLMCDQAWKFLRLGCLTVERRGLAVLLVYMLLHEPGMSCSSTVQRLLPVVEVDHSSFCSDIIPLSIFKFVYIIINFEHRLRLDAERVLMASKLG